MLYAFLEDSTLEIVEDVAEARRCYEGIDVGSDVVQFFDENGRRLKAHFTVPNRSGKYFGIIRWVESGVYDLAPDPDPAADSIEIALLETSMLVPNRWFASLDAVRAAVSAKGLVRPPGQ